MFVGEGLCVHDLRWIGSADAGLIHADRRGPERRPRRRRVAGQAAFQVMEPEHGLRPGRHSGDGDATPVRVEQVVELGGVRRRRGAAIADRIAVSRVQGRELGRDQQQLGLLLHPTLPYTDFN